MNIRHRTAKYVSTILKDRVVVERFIRNPLHGEILEFPGGNTVMLATDEGMLARDLELYRSKEGVKFFQRVRVVRGKTGKARRGQQRLIMVCDPTEISTQLELAVRNAFESEDEAAKS